jgi:hypothetical protein
MPAAGGIPGPTPTDLSVYYPNGSGGMADVSVSSLPSAGAPERPRGGPLRIKRGSVPTMRAQWEKNRDDEYKRTQDATKADLDERKFEAQRVDSDRRFGQLEKSLEQRDRHHEERLAHDREMAEVRHESTMLRMQASDQTAAGRIEQGRRLTEIANLKEQLYRASEAAEKFRSTVAKGDPDRGFGPGFDVRTGSIDPSSPFFTYWQQYSQKEAAVKALKKEIQARQQAYEQVHGSGMFAGPAETQAQTPPTHAGSGATQAPAPESQPGTPAPTSPDAKSFAVREFLKWERENPRASEEEKRRMWAGLNAPR